MSNQVYSNRYADGTRYLPLPKQRDVLTLIKSTVPVPPVVPYGEQTKVAPNTGNGLFFNRLNKNNCTIVGTLVNYDLFQSPDTKQFWKLNANSTILNGATVLYSKVDNVISVNCVLPVDYPSPAAGQVPITFAIRVMNSDFSIVGDYSLNGRDITAGSNPVAFSVSATVRVLAGQMVMIIALGTGQTLRYQDDLKGTNNIIHECLLEFAKM